MALIVFVRLNQLWGNILPSEAFFNTQVVYIKNVKFSGFVFIQYGHVQWATGYDAY
jgi:hypothetical protein